MCTIYPFVLSLIYFYDGDGTFMAYALSTCSKGARKKKGSKLDLPLVAPSFPTPSLSLTRARQSITDVEMKRKRERAGRKRKEKREASPCVCVCVPRTCGESLRCPLAAKWEDSVSDKRTRERSGHEERDVSIDRSTAASPLLSRALHPRCVFPLKLLLSTRKMVSSVQMDETAELR